jgi:protein-L-isoaspartate(D-aspartate) O-methyltransferase
MAVRKSIHDFSRHSMLDLLERRGVQDRCVLAAMIAVPRERFVLPTDVLQAYADRPLPIDEGQTISQPYVVALAIEQLQLRPDDRVLEIGTGSGYSTAVLSQLVPHVDSIERIPELASSARTRLAALGFDGIDVRCGDGTVGWPERAPYDAIIAWAAAPELPRAPLDQLSIGGRLVMPVGTAGRQELMLVTKQTGGCSVTRLGSVVFVPLVAG